MASEESDSDKPIFSTRDVKAIIEAFCAMGPNEDCMEHALELAGDGGDNSDAAVLPVQDIYELLVELRNSVIPNKEGTFMPIELTRPKRNRRKAELIVRDWTCYLAKCKKVYGTVNALKNHFRLKHKNVHFDKKRAELVHEDPMNPDNFLYGRSPSGASTSTSTAVKIRIGRDELMEPPKKRPKIEDAVPKPAAAAKPAALPPADHKKPQVPQSMPSIQQAAAGIPTTSRPTTTPSSSTKLPTDRPQPVPLPEPPPQFFPDGFLPFGAMHPAFPYFFAQPPLQTGAMLLAPQPPGTMMPPLGGRLPGLHDLLPAPFPK